MDFLEQLDQLSDNDVGHTQSDNQNQRQAHTSLPTSSRCLPPQLNNSRSVWNVNTSPSGSDDNSSFTAAGRPSNETSSSNIYYHDDASSKATLVPRSILSDKAQSVFNFSHFNRMQSKCFDMMYEQDDNCVVSSPTGSGKTVLFELAILRLLKSHQNTNNIKILYIAPTKALCVEREKDWQSKFSTFGLSVGTLTSDTGFVESDKVKRCNVIITTPEKWDLMTRKWSDYTRLFELIKLILIDEIHILREDRGSTLEVVVTRMKKICLDIRIVALSATVPNIQDVASWIKLSSSSPNNATTMIFGEEYRPVRLEKVICSYRQNGNDFVFDSFLNSRLVEVLNVHSKGKPVLVFCPTRSSTVSTAKYIASHFYSEASLTYHSASVKERELSQLVQKGVAYHHAGLSMGDRESIEKGFINGSIKILCSTSTLAVGVNLPAYLVLIKGTKIWNSTLFEEYSELDILQMMGRAGRPQFETQGKAVLMTSQDMQRRYDQLVKGNEKLESRLHLNLHENLVSEVHLRTISSLEDALDWLKHTFFYSRYHANPTAYGEIPFYDHTDSDGRLMRYTEEKLRELSDFMLIKLVGGTYKSTAYGDSMTRHYILFDTMKMFIKEPVGRTMTEILVLLSKAAEFKTIRLKRTEKRLFKEINESPILRYPFKSDKKQNKKVDDAYEKISLLVQYELGGLEYPNHQDLIKLQQSFKQDKLYVFKHIPRLTRCLIDVFVEKKDFMSLKNCLILSSCLNGGCWEHTSMIMKQLDGVNLSHVRRLTNHNVLNFSLISGTEPSKIEYFLGLKPGIGTKVRNQVDSLPKLRIQNSVMKVTRPRDGSGLRFTVECFLDVTSEIKKWKGKMLSIVATSGLSTGEGVDFRRSIITKVMGSSSFSISFTVEYTGTKLRTVVLCEEIAGLTAETELDLCERLSEAQMSALKLGKPTDDGFETESDDDDLDSLMIKASSSTKGTKRPTGEASNERPTLENDNFQCKHTCKDKTKCRHMCCREGIAPSTAKKLKTTAAAHSNPVKPTKIQKDDSGFDLLKKLHTNSVRDSRLTTNQLSRYKFGNTSSPPTKKQTSEIDTLDDDHDNDDDLDVISLLKLKAKVKPRVERSAVRETEPASEEIPSTHRPNPVNTSGDNLDSIMGVPNQVTESVNETSLSMIHLDIEQFNRDYQNRTEYTESRQGREDIISSINFAEPHCQPDHPQPLPHDTYTSNHEETNRDQSMAEILDNTLEEELEGLFGSDVEIV